RRARPEDVLVVLRGELEHRHQPLAGVGALLLLGREFLQLDAGALRQQLEGAPLVCFLDQLHEREDVAVALAPKAVPGLALGVDLEAGAVLLVEGTQAPQVLVPLREPDVLLDDLDQVDLGLDLGEGIVLGSPRTHAKGSEFAGHSSEPGVGTVLLSAAMALRSIAWVKDEARGLEFAEVDLDASRLRATGVAIGTAPEPYRLDYALATGDEFVTTELQVSARGEGWQRSLRLVRDEDGSWTANGSREGGLSEALDCDLAWSPL